MNNDIRYDASLAAAMLILELFDTSPQAAKFQILGQVIFIILEAMYEAERRLAEITHAAEPSVN